MSIEEYIFTGLILALALGYIYKSLFKSKGCGSCGCGDEKSKISKTKCSDS